MSLFQHELASGDVLVACHDGAVVGFAAVLERGSVAYLSELFVDPDHQSLGIGRQLLSEVLRDRHDVVCTLSSSDPRAVPLYARWGMRPCWPNFWLFAASGDISAPTASNVAVTVANDPDEIVEWDASLSGRHRPEAHAYWINHEQGVPLWLRRATTRIGYAYARMRSPLALSNPDAATVGPVGVRQPDGASDAVAAVVAWTAQRAPSVRFSIPGPHSALHALLEWGMRITETEIFLSTDPNVLDPHRYLTSGDQL